MSLSVEPLPKKFFDRALALGINEIILHWSGGNDEGYLNVELNPKWDDDLAQDIEEWGYDAYSYNGAGDGTDYGDDVTYDLVEKRATVQEWSMARTEGDLEVEENAFEEDDNTNESKA